ncbi:T9SS type A sorting domain-containing protein [candidate division KSB1 bacterium]
MRNILPLGIAEREVDICKVYPNPAREVVYVEIVSPTYAIASVGKNGEWRMASFELVDMFGKVMLKEDLKQGRNRYVVSVKELPEGIYILRVMSADFMVRKKIVVIK